MVTKFAKAVLLTASISSTLMSCSKQDDVQPAATSAVTPSKDGQVKLVNGRVVFADLAALLATRDALDKAGNSQNGAQALVDWEKSLQFSSLRAAAKAEENQLEALETKGTPTPAHNLMAKFGFPTSYASLINPVGEYQVADKIYWFHDGVKYEASSEEELAAIKQNPASAKVKLAAGYRIIQSSKGTAPDQANRTYANNSSDLEGKWYYGYYQNNDPGSERRIKYITFVYTEQQYTFGSAVYWNTGVYLQAKHEYYSRGKRAWYPVGGQPFNWTVNVSFDATVSTYYQGNILNTYSTQYGSINNQVQFDSGSYSTFAIASANVTTQTNLNQSSSDIRWNYEVNGSISGYNVNDPTYGTYNISGLLW